MGTCAMRTPIAYKRQYKTQKHYAPGSLPAAQRVKDYAPLNYILYHARSDMTLDNLGQVGEGKDEEQIWCCAELTANAVYKPKNTDFTTGTSNFNSVIGWRIY